jgi:hypothetical protein
MFASSCFSFPAGDRCLTIRESLVKICDGNACAAAIVQLLNEVEAYSRIAEGQGKPACYMASSDIADQLFFTWHQVTISDAIRFLEEKGFVETDYNTASLVVKSVNQALEALGGES